MAARFIFFVHFACFVVPNSFIDGVGLGEGLSIEQRRSVTIQIRCVIFFNYETRETRERVIVAAHFIFFVYFACFVVPKSFINGVGDGAGFSIERRRSVTIQVR